VSCAINYESGGRTFESFGVHQQHQTILLPTTALQTHLLSAKSRHAAADRTASGMSGIVDCGPDRGHGNIDVNDPTQTSV